MVVVDLAVFYGYMAFKSKVRPTTDTPAWATKPNRDRLVRKLIRARDLRRHQVVERLAGSRGGGGFKSTVDRWCDDGRRPQDASLHALAHVLERDPLKRDLLRQTLRRHFALRDLLDELRRLLDDEIVADLVDAFLRLAQATYDRLEQTRVQTGMKGAICDMVLGDWMRAAPSPKIVEHLLRVEPEPHEARAATPRL